MIIADAKERVMGEDCGMEEGVQGGAQVILRQIEQAPSYARRLQSETLPTYLLTHRGTLYTNVIDTLEVTCTTGVRTRVTQAECLPS